jgi:hypothetical protein
MIVNELRTVLLNQSGSNSPGASYPGEEYVPPSFTAKAMPGSLATVWNQLFAPNSDRAYLNWRLRDYLTILHTTEMVEHVTALDPRITYWPFDNSLFTLAGGGAGPPIVTAVANPQNQSLRFSGPVVIVQSGNLLYFSWLVTVVDAANVQVQQNFGAQQVVNTTYTTSGGWSSPVPLPGSSLMVQFSSGLGGVWRITALAPTSHDLTDVLANLAKQLDDTTKSTLFGPAGSEPWTTFRNLWEQHSLLPYRLGGVVLALGYQLAGWGK